MLLQRGLVGHLFPHIETHDSYQRKPEQSRVRFDCRGHQLHPFPRLWRYFKVGLPCRLRVKSEARRSDRRCRWPLHSALPLRVARLFLQVVRHLRSQRGCGGTGVFPTGFIIRRPQTSLEAARPTLWATTGEAGKVSQHRQAHKNKCLMEVQWQLFMSCESIYGKQRYKLNEERAERTPSRPLRRRKMQLASPWWPWHKHANDKNRQGCSTN